MFQFFLGTVPVVLLRLQILLLEIAVHPLSQWATSMAIIIRTWRSRIPEERLRFCSVLALVLLLAQPLLRLSTELDQ
jgi:hypothetical protein